MRTLKHVWLWADNKAAADAELEGETWDKCRFLADHLNTACPPPPLPLRSVAVAANRTKSHCFGVVAMRTRPYEALI